MKRFISILLAAAMLFSIMSIQSFASQNNILGANNVKFDNAQDATASGAAITYDSNFDALMVTPNEVGGSVEVSLTATGLTSSSGIYGVYIWFPSESCYSGDSFTISAGTQAAVGCTAQTGYLFNAYTVSSSSAPGTFTLAITADETDSFFIFGISDMSDANAVSAFAAAANGSLTDDMVNEDTLGKYDPNIYTQNYWDAENGGIVYNESFMPLKNSSGTLEPIQLMYDVDRVVSVRNAYLNTEYTYGVDYTFEDGKLVILPDGAIHIYNYTDVYSDTQKNSSWRKTTDGRYAYCGQLNMYFVGYFNVTYTTSSAWEGPVPEGKAYLLSNSIEKLNNNETVKLLSIGDSLAGGANASADLNVEPYADIWCDMTAKKVQLMYPDAVVQTQTIAQGGATASLCIEKMSDIIAYDPDLVFIEFGTNDCMQGDAPDGYIETLRQAIASIKENIPGCDIILVAPIISNPLFFNSNDFYAYADALYALEQDGVAVANVTSELQYLLTRKDYIDMTGDFLCHPSDFVTRVFVQTIAGTLVDNDLAELRQALIKRLLSYRYQSEFSDENLILVNTYIQSGSDAINSAATESAATEAYLAAAKQIDAVETLADAAASANLDCANLVFNTLRSYDTVTIANNVTTKYDSDSESIVMTVVSARGAYQNIDYSISSPTVFADNYGYAVITMKAPSSNSTLAKTPVFTFTANDAELPQKRIDIINDGEYHSYIVLLSSDDGWTGEVSNLKITPYATCATGDSLYIHSIVLCSDDKSAEDTAIEREHAANKDAATAETYLFFDDASTAALTAPDSVDVLLGDANGDGKLTAKDALYIKKYIVGVIDSVPSAISADMDGDGNITSSDLLSLTKTLARITEKQIVSKTFAEISYSEQQKAAEINCTSASPQITYDLTGKNLSADMFKYVTVCAKSDDASEISVKVTMTTENGSEESTIVFSSSSSFQAETARLTKLTGDIESLSFTFIAPKDSVLYFDSFVLTPTISAALNAETVRVGAANLI